MNEKCWEAQGVSCGSLSLGNFFSNTFANNICMRIPFPEYMEQSKGASVDGLSYNRQDLSNPSRGRNVYHLIKDSTHPLSS